MEEQEYKEFQTNNGTWARRSSKETRRRFTPVRYVCSGTANNYPRAPVVVVKISEFTASLFART